MKARSSMGRNFVKYTERKKRERERRRRRRRRNSGTKKKKIDRGM